MEDINELFSLDIYPEKPKVFTEAVFKDGKKKVEPLLKDLAKVKEVLNEKMQERKFDLEGYWRDQAWKDFEDHMVEIFGFRSAYISPNNDELYNVIKKEKADVLNAYIYQDDRYYIEGVVTDSGFYDKTHSCNIKIDITLGLLKKLEPDELLAILLHEIGHSIDPAFVDIRYTEMNILTKYLTDRKSELNKSEKSYIRKASDDGIVVIGSILAGIILTIPLFFKWLYQKIFHNKIEQKKLDKIRKAIEKDNDKFDRVNFSEAYADNFARMYGYGPELIRGLKKVSDNSSKMYRSWFEKELDREELLTQITKDTINDCHKTNIHRIRALIKEYDADIKDPKIPKKVKEYLKKDKEEVEKVLDQYLNHFDDFQKRINRIINEELEKKDPLLKKDIEEAKNEKPIKEYALGFNISEVDEYDI